MLCLRSSYDLYVVVGLPQRVTFAAFDSFAVPRLGPPPSFGELPGAVDKDERIDQYSPIPLGE
jgi:hypothetical protein